MFLKLYRNILRRSDLVLEAYLNRRLKKGKEDPKRFDERKGIASRERPPGLLIWIHAASVGEAQSALILIKALNEQIGAENFSVLVTSVTRTSAGLMAERLPDNAYHQFAPVDHPDWLRRFFDHWQPDIAFCIESELWPNTLRFLRKRHIPSALINARMSKTSYKRWKLVGDDAKKMLSSFDIILTQTEEHEEWFENLGAHSVITTDNLKYSAKPLPVDEKELKKTQKALKGRPVWVYASTHDGEESLACETHINLKKKFPDIATIIVPRHPERRSEIEDTVSKYNLPYQLRSVKPDMATKTEIYIADTMGELGLFYTLSDIAVIGRTFSNDGGGGHNPMEAALLDAVPITGPNYQNQTQLVRDMLDGDAILVADNKAHLLEIILSLLQSADKMTDKKQKALEFAAQKANVIDHVMEEIEPLFLKKGLHFKK